MTHVEQLLRAIRRLECANIEYRRAVNAGTQPRLNKAGTSQFCAEANVFVVARQIRKEIENG